MLQIKNLSFNYAETPLLEQVSFTLSEGQLLHLKGSNGSGKTTFLKLISGILSPFEGEIYFKDQNITQDLKAYQKNLCYIGHKPGISPVLTARQNLQFDRHYDKDSTIFNDIIETLSLKQLLDTPCRELSAGQKRRVALIRLWMTQAKLWLLDEPFTALDTHSIHVMKDKCLTHLEQGGAIILTSHQPIPLPPEAYKEYCL